jgi:hypothetical protein
VVLLTALGFYMWPHTFGSSLTARNEDVFRRNAIFMPLYQLLIAFVLLVGLIGSAGMLCALVPGSMLLITSATIVSRNIYRGLNPSASERTVTGLTQVLVPVIALGAVAFVCAGGQTIVTLLLLGYALVTQLLPALLLSLARPGWVTKAGAIAGIVVGEALVAAMTFSGATPGSSTTLDTLVGGLPASLADLNLGVVALVANFAVTALVSTATRSGDEGARVAEDEPRFSRGGAKSRRSSARDRHSRVAVPGVPLRPVRRVGAPADDASKADGPGGRGSCADPCDVVPAIDGQRRADPPRAPRAPFDAAVRGPLAPTKRRPSASTSPAPSTRHRSPSRSIGPTTRSAAAKSGSHSTGRPRAASAAVSAIVSPETPGKSAARSRAG